MTMAEVRVKQWGNSLGLIISKDIARHEGINVGDIVKVDISKEKRVDGFGILKGGPPFIRESDDREF